MTATSILSGSDFGTRAVKLEQDVKDTNIVTGDGNIIINVENSASSETAVLHQLPPRLNHFMGRTAELKTLTEKIDRDAVNVINLWGMGGVGKTELASQVANQLISHYPDAQIYLNLEGDKPVPSSFDDVILYIIRSFEPRYISPDKKPELIAKYRSLLHNRRVLLLMDNTANSEQIILLRPHEKCLLLVTSRNNIQIEGLFSLNVETLNIEDACKLLLKIAPRIDAFADTIATLCGCIPLALIFAANAVAKYKTISVKAYIQRLMKSQERLKLIESVMQSSYNLLSPELKYRWRVLAIFPETFDVHAVAKVWNVDLEIAHDNLSELIAFSFIQINEATTRCHLHDLARLFAEQKLKPKERENVIKYHAIHFQKILAGLFFGEANEDQQLNQISFDWSNIATGFTWASERINEDKVAAELCRDYVVKAYSILGNRQHPRERLHWAQLATKAAQNLLDRNSESILMSIQGWAYSDLGDVAAAIHCHKESLNIAQETGNKDYECIALSNLGTDLRMSGNPQLAIAYLEQCLVVAAQVHNQWRMSHAYGHLGLAYADLKNIARSIECYNQQLRLARQNNDLYNEASALGSLGFAYLYLDKSEPENGILHFNQWLSIVRGLEDRRSEGNALGGIGLAYQMLGKYELAIKYCNEQIDIAKKIGDRRGEGAALGTLGKVYIALGEMQRGIDHFKQHIEVALAIPDRRGVGDSSWNLGLAYEMIGKLELAVKAMQVSVDYEQEIQHPSAQEKAQRVFQLRSRIIPS